MPRSRRSPVDMSLEEFDAWSNAQKAFNETAEAAEESGGPRLAARERVEQ